MGRLNIACLKIYWLILFWLIGFLYQCVEIEQLYYNDSPKLIVFRRCLLPVFGGTLYYISKRTGTTSLGVIATAGIAIGVAILISSEIGYITKRTEIIPYLSMLTAIDNPSTFSFSIAAQILILWWIYKSKPDDYSTDFLIQSGVLLVLSIICYACLTSEHPFLLYICLLLTQVLTSSLIAKIITQFINLIRYFL